MYVSDSGRFSTVLLCCNLLDHKLDIDYYKKSCFYIVFCCLNSKYIGVCIGSIGGNINFSPALFVSRWTCVLCPGQLLESDRWRHGWIWSAGWWCECAWFFLFWNHWSAYFTFSLRILIQRAELQFGVKQSIVIESEAPGLRVRTEPKCNFPALICFHYLSQAIISLFSFHNSVLWKKVRLCLCLCLLRNKACDDVLHAGNHCSRITISEGPNC